MLHKLNEMKRLATLLVGIILIISDINAVSRYTYPGNGYASLLHNATVPNNVTVSNINDFLEITNNTASDYCITDTTTLPLNFTYSVKMANVNNRRGKSVKVMNNDGTVNKVYSQRWGVLIDKMPNGDMITVELCCNNEDAYNEVTDNKIPQIILSKHTASTTTVLKSEKVEKDINLNDGDNILSVKVNGENITVLIGRKNPKKVLEATIERKLTNSHVGIIAGPGTSLKVKRTMLNYEKDNRIVKYTRWNHNTLTEYFKKSTNPIEGYWQYLDRDTEDKWMRMGGRYTIAIVETEKDNYEIIYCDGAQVKKNEWIFGMLKGNMTPTIFDNTFNGMWIDSIFEPITEDVQFSIEEGVILTVKFPVYKSQIRFSKVIK